MALTEYSNRAVRVTRAWYGVRRGQILDKLPAARRRRLIALNMVEPIEAGPKRDARATAADVP